MVYEILHIHFYLFKAGEHRGGRLTSLQRIQQQARTHSLGFRVHDITGDRGEDPTPSVLFSIPTFDLI